MWYVLWHAGPTFEPLPSKIAAADVLTAPSFYVKHTRASNSSVPSIVMHPLVKSAVFRDLHAAPSPSHHNTCRALIGSDLGDTELVVGM